MPEFKKNSPEVTRNVGGDKTSGDNIPVHVEQFEQASPDRVSMTDESSSGDIIISKKGHVRWSVLQKDSERLRSFIEHEAVKFLDQHGDISGTLLDKQGKSGLRAAVSAYYPGKWRELRRNIGLDNRKSPPNYWTNEVIEQEAKCFFVKKCGRKHYPSSFCSRTSLNRSIQSSRCSKESAWRVSQFSRLTQFL